jgi:hypothetical protein
VFTFYALMFNGLVYAMLTSDATFSNLTKLQRMLRFPTRSCAGLCGRTRTHARLRLLL